MDSRILHIAVEKALRTVEWDKHGEHEYVLVGDGQTFNCDKLQLLIDLTFTAQTVWMSPDRHTAIALPRSGAAREVISRISHGSAITVSDDDVRVFLQVHSMGVARTGRAQADYSFKPKQIRGSA